mmetsp:Transcript_22145/g.55163  ORF Transcript_22145/g.55163 Transcript_22145/m.55163 type:complete len:228 (+) Transcript_22145:25-708(+)
MCESFYIYVRPGTKLNQLDSYFEDLGLLDSVLLSPLSLSLFSDLLLSSSLDAELSGLSEVLSLSVFSGLSGVSFSFSFLSDFFFLSDLSLLSDFSFLSDLFFSSDLSFLFDFSFLSDFCFLSDLSFVSDLSFLSDLSLLLETDLLLSFSFSSLSLEEDFCFCSDLLLRSVSFLFPPGAVSSGYALSYPLSSVIRPPAGTASAPYGAAEFANWKAPMPPPPSAAIAAK